MKKRRPDSTQRYVIAIFYVLFIGVLVLFGFKGFKSDSEGDENFYSSQAQYLQNNGFSKSIIEGNPVGYSYSIIYLTKVFGGTFRTNGRLLSILSIIPILLAQSYISKTIFHLGSWSHHLVNIFSLQALVGSGYIFRAISDIFFTAVLIWGLIFLYKTTSKRSGWRNALIAGMLLCASLLIRPLTLLYLPGILLSLLVTFVYYLEPAQKKGFLRSCALVTFTFIGLFCLAQSPSLIENGRFSFEDKNPSKSLTWIQRQTLSQLRYDEGTLQEGHHVTWDELQAYLNEHGQDSLPKGSLERAQWKPLLVAREFVKDLSISSNYIFLRRTGLLYLLPFVFLSTVRRFPEVKRRILFFLIIAFSYVLVLNSIILTNIEWRHLILPILLSVAIGMASLRYFAGHSPRLAKGIYVVQIGFLIAAVSLDLRSLATGRM